MEVAGESASIAGETGLAKVDIAAALRESVSFGRFVNESLEWGRWPSFSQNKYIEEAERYSSRGSVARKKAFFEEHYKRVAARKKEAAEQQLEQEKEGNGARTNPAESESELADVHHANVLGDECHDGEFHCVSGVDNRSRVLEPDDNQSRVLLEPDDNKSRVLESDGNTADRAEISENASLTNSVAKCEVSDPENCALEIQKPPERPEFEEEKSQVEVSKEIGSEICEMELTKCHQPQKSPLKENNAHNQQPPAIIHKKTKASETKASILGILNKSKPKSPCNNKPRKESKSGAGLLGKKTAKIPSDKKISTQNSSHTSIHQSHRQECGTTETCHVPKYLKASESKLKFGCFKAFQDFPSSCRTPTKDLAKGEPKVVPVAPRTENRKKKEKTESSAKKNNSKWNLLSHGKSSCIGNGTSCSPQVVSTFFIRSEERAERRKECFMKLEEKLNAGRLEREAKAKEKAENELKLLRQRLGFKARPLPKFYQRKDPPKQDRQKSSPGTRSQTQNLGRARGGQIALTKNKLSSQLRETL